jgi:AraC family transcriptional activator of pyochelin receptor
MLAAARHAVAELLDEAGLGGRLPGIAGDELPEAEVARIYRARELLLADLHNPPTIKELARLTGTNARKLSLGFRALYGQPPFAYLKAYRLEQALAALRRGERPVQAIAAEVGYRPAHLSAAFRKRFGRPPSAYDPDDLTVK